jgi:predicted ester cyclase
MGAAPTGKQCSYTYIAIDRIVDGKVVESWLEWDEAGLLRQMGVLE